jgi:hypothetical protein
MPESLCALFIFMFLNNTSVENLTRVFEGVTYTEEWSSIEGWPNHRVSTFGRIKRSAWITKTEGRLKPEKIIRAALCQKGYPRINLSDKGFSKKFPVHRLVAKAFLKKIRGKPHVNHINCVKHDNFYKNLEWCTAKENNEHARLHINFASSKNRFSKITEEERGFIKKNFFLLGKDKLAEKFGLHPSTVWGIGTNRDGRGKPIFLGARRHSVTKPIIHLECGVFYESVKELSMFIGVKPKYLYKRLGREVENNTPYRYA